MGYEKKGHWWKRIVCWVKGHRLEFDNQEERRRLVIRCSRCGGWMIKVDLDRINGQ
jgi:hypothetical protein